ncbi:MAG: type II secretion system protein [Phycisphaerales bacterium]
MNPRSRLRKRTYEHRAGRPGRGFTIVELLVVIGIIVLLVGLLLPALAGVRRGARKTQTSNLMANLGMAADSFYQSIGRYPGVLSERELCGDNTIYNEWSGTENALLDLMGGLEARGDTGDTFDLGGLDIYRDDIGRGPVIGDTKYAAYFQPQPEDLFYVQGQLGQDDVDNNQPTSGDDAFPDLVDAFGAPILFWRHSGQKSTLNNSRIVDLEAISTESASYYISSFQSYANSSVLAVNKNRSVIDQQARSLLSADNQRDAITLGQLIAEHPAMPGTARSRYIIMSAGPDQVYFDRETVEGVGLSPDEPDVLERFDDIVQYGGG